MSIQQEKIKELVERRAKARMGGGQKRIDAQHAKERSGCIPQETIGSACKAPGSKKSKSKQTISQSGEISPLCFQQERAHLSFPRKPLIVFPMKVSL